MGERIPFKFCTSWALLVEKIKNEKYCYCSWGPVNICCVLQMNRLIADFTWLAESLGKDWVRLIIMLSCIDVKNLWVMNGVGPSPLARARLQDNNEATICNAPSPFEFSVTLWVGVSQIYAVLLTHSFIMLRRVTLGFTKSCIQSFCGSICVEPYSFS